MPIRGTTVVAAILAVGAAAAESTDPGIAKVSGDAVVAEDFVFAKRYAGRRSDYYIRRAAAAKSDHPIACELLLAAAREISPENASVTARAAALGCDTTAELGDDRHSESTVLQLGRVRDWASRPPLSPSVTAPAPPAGGSAHDLFSTPFGFVHVSELGLKNWTRTLLRFSHAARRKFKEVQQKARRGNMRTEFVHVNNFFFKHQDSHPHHAMREPGSWKELYSSPEYREWATASSGICSTFARKLGIPLSDEEERRMELVTWAAVYPAGLKDDVTHYYHAHQESIVSFVLYVRVPRPTTPLTISDPRGAPPIEDFEWFQDAGDLGVDGEPPFHRPFEFYADEGDVLVFPSYAIHKVPPHIGNGTRVVFPSNCHLPKTQKAFDLAGQHLRGELSPLDGWERIARWPRSNGSRAGALDAYRAHAAAAVSVARHVDDPYMKMWEAQNQIVAMVQSAPLDARAWLAAGNVSMDVAAVLDARDEGQYYMDAAMFLAEALRLDPEIKPELDVVLGGLLKRVPKKMKEQYRNMETWVHLVQSWGTSPPSIEVRQLYNPLINGPGKCKDMCPSSAAPKYEAMRILPGFSTRVVVQSLGTAGSEEERLTQAVAVFLRGDTLGPAAPKDAGPALSPLPEHAGAWRQRNKTASLTAVVCDGSAEIWFHDPRGIWPERWAGGVPRGDAADVLGVEPKAPFHWHSSIACVEGQAVIFPAWLPHRVAPVGGSAQGAAAPRARAFAVSVDDGAGGTMGWRLPRPPLIGGVDGASVADFASVGAGSIRSEL